MNTATSAVENKSGGGTESDGIAGEGWEEPGLELGDGRGVFPAWASRGELWRALWNWKCPRCLDGEIQGPGGTRDACATCGLRFDREHGYFTGAMYISYGIGIPFIAAGTLALWAVLPSGWPPWVALLGAWGLFLPLTPRVFAWSRVLWIWFERWCDPGEGEAPSPVELERRRRLESGSESESETEANGTGNPGGA